MSRQDSTTVVFSNKATASGFFCLSLPNTVRPQLLPSRAPKLTSVYRSYRKYYSHLYHVATMSDKENDIDLELKNDLRKWQGLPLKACGDDAHVATSPITPLPAPVITLGTNRHNSDNATSDWVSSVPTGTTPSKSTLSESSPIHTTAAMETPPLPGPETPPIPSSPQTDDVLPTVELQPPPDHDAVDYDNMDLNDVPTPGGPYSQSPAAPSKPVQITPSVASKDLTPERDETPTPVAGPKKKGIAGKDKTPPKARDNPKHTGDTTESNEDAYAPSPPSVKGKGNVKTPVKAIDASKHTGDTTESAEDAGDPTPRPTIKGKGKAALKSKVTLQKTPFEGKGASTGGTTSKKRGKAAGASDDEELESPAKKQKSTSAKQKTPAKAKTMNVDSDEDKPANMVKRKGRAAARPVKDRNRKAPVDIVGLSRIEYTCEEVAD